MNHEDKKNASADGHKGGITNLHWSIFVLFAACLFIGALVGRYSIGSKGFSYDGKEFEFVKNLANFDSIDQMTLKLREKQPIFFLGLPMRQIPTDNWLVSELIHQIQPDYIIEAGTLYGGSAIYYASQLQFVNPEAKVISIDINRDQIDPAAMAHPLWDERVIFIEGSSTAPEVIEQIRAKIGKDKKVLVTLDTLHAPDHVMKELELYSQFVSKDSYMILQDTYYDGLPEVLDKFLDDNEGWSQDSKLDERFIFTKYRGGFLKRKQ